jgi:hypothetical protein
MFEQDVMNIIATLDERIRQLEKHIHYPHSEVAMKEARHLEPNGMTILAALEDCLIVDFTLSGDRVIVAEMCDGYFERSLSKEQFVQMIAELQLLLEKMP